MLDEASVCVGGVEWGDGRDVVDEECVVGGGKGGEG